MGRSEAAILDQPSSQKVARVSTYGALAVGAGYVDGLPREMDIVEQTGDALEPRLDHDCMDGQVSKILKRRVTGFPQTTATRWVRWTRMHDGVDGLAVDGLAGWGRLALAVVGDGVGVHAPGSRGGFAHRRRRGRGRGRSEHSAGLGLSVVVRAVFALHLTHNAGAPTLSLTPALRSHLTPVRDTPGLSVHLP